MNKYYFSSFTFFNTTLRKSFTISMVQIKNDELFLLFVLVNIHHLPLFNGVGAFHFFGIDVDGIGLSMVFCCLLWT